MPIVFNFASLPYAHALLWQAAAFGERWHRPNHSSDIPQRLTGENLAPVRSDWNKDEPSSRCLSQCHTGFGIRIEVLELATYLTTYLPQHTRWPRTVTRISKHMMSERHWP